jgi:hypothetical protein
MIHQRLSDHPAEAEVVEVVVQNLQLTVTVEAVAEAVAEWSLSLQRQLR